MDNRVWDEFLKKHIEIPSKMKAFLEEIAVVCRKYNLSIAHEDEQCGFYVESYKECNIQWLLSASKKYTCDAADDSGVQLAPEYVGEGCPACPSYCLRCKYLNYCFGAWDQPAQEHLLNLISNSKSQEY